MPHLITSNTLKITCFLLENWFSFYICSVYNRFFIFYKVNWIFTRVLLIKANLVIIGTCYHLWAVTLACYKFCNYIGPAAVTRTSVSNFSFGSILVLEVSFNNSVIICSLKPFRNACFRQFIFEQLLHCWFKAYYCTSR